MQYLLFVLFLFMVPSLVFENFSNGADLQEDILSSLCRTVQGSFLALKPSKKQDGTKEESTDMEDKEIKAMSEEFSKLCRLQIPNISHSLEWFQKYSLDDYADKDAMMNLLGQILFETIEKLFKTRPKCRLTLSTLVSGVNSGPENWPLQMLDASGKPLSGILKGALHWTGDFYQCTDINMPIMPGNITEENPLIRGQYCTLHIAIPEQFKKLVVPAHMNKVFKDKLDSYAIKWDFCSPQHCPAEDLKSILEPISDRVNASLGIELTKITCKKPVHAFRDNTAIGTLTLIGIIGLFLLIGTVYDILCCNGDSESDDNTFIITDDVDIDLQAAVHYNSAYEMDTASFDSSTNTLSQNKDPEITENRPSDIVLLSTRSTESCSIKESETDAINRKPAPVAPVPPSMNLPQEPQGATPTPLEVGLSVSDLNTNQNANSLNINGQIPSVMHTLAEHDIYKSKLDSDRGFGSFLLAFSIRRNAYQLLNTEHSVERLSCLNGIRFFSMAWIILGHTYMIASEDYIKNIVDGIDLYQRFTFQAVLAAPFAVDTFFLLSGILVTYFFLENYYRKGNIGLKTVILMYVRRYLRLTPCYAVILMVYTFILPNLFEGPYWQSDFSEICQSRWWTNLLYINNIFKLEDGCMFWTWYLANDMQFFIISPIILCQFILLPSFAFLTIVMMFSAYIVSSVILWQRLPDPSAHSVINDDIYTKPWCRISPFLIGIILGYFLQQKSRKRSFPKCLQLCGWTFAVSTCLFLSYIKYTMNKENPLTWLNSQYTAYEVVSHPLWAMAVSWVIIICAAGNGGMISHILSWKFWIIMNRLTYCAYLLHPIIIMVGMRMSMTPLYLSNATTIYAFIGHLTISYGVAFIVSLLFEMPIRMLEKVMSNRK